MDQAMHRTIPELLWRAAEDAGDKPWLLAGEQSYTYTDALDQVQRAMSVLRAEGVGHGTRVLVTARNEPTCVFAWLAIAALGAIQIPINPASTPEELAGFISQVEPASILTDSGLAEAVGVAYNRCGATGSLVEIGALFTAAADQVGPADVDERDLAVMIPTSGTTGRSKLVMQTHLAYVMAAEGFPWWLGLTSEDRLLTSLPLFHLNAPAYSVLGSLAARASVVLLPGFSAHTFLDSARRYGATQFNAIGAMIEILMRQPRAPNDHDHSIRLCYTGPAPDRDRQLEIERRFGFEIRSGYALSESTYGLVWPRGERPYGTLGSARQHPELGHVNDARITEAGHVLGPGETGELELRNPAIMVGYYEMPEETAEVLHDGWLRTGDLVTDNGDGTYTFVGRKKQVIRRRGENLSPTEVEAVLERHPSVLEAAVIGVVSELSEEEVKAFVVAASSLDFDATDVAAFAARYLAAFKVPRYFEIVGELPHTPTGRLAKHRLPTGRTPTEIDLRHGWPAANHPR